MRTKTKNFLLWVFVLFAFTVTSCKDDGNKPPSPKIDPDEMIELITDTTWFDTCGCLAGTKYKDRSIKEQKVWIVLDTSLKSLTPSEVKEILDARLLYMGGDINSSCPAAFIWLRNFEQYWICNFPINKFKKIKRPCIFEATISGEVYYESFEGDIIKPDHVSYDLFLTSFKIPYKYIGE